MHNPFNVVRDFEAALCEYTGARYAVTTTSCTSAILVALSYIKHHYGQQRIEIPSRTYVGVAMSIINAGHLIGFRDEDWTGWYELKDTGIWDSARWVSGGMYEKCTGNVVCLSLHWSKHIAVSQGGVILHDDPHADEWYRRARFDGRREGVAPKDDDFDMIGQHCYLSPSVAAEGLVRLKLLPKENMPLRNGEYPDLSKAKAFKRYMA